MSLYYGQNMKTEIFHFSHHSYGSLNADRYKQSKPVIGLKHIVPASLVQKWLQVLVANVLI